MGTGPRGAIYNAKHPKRKKKMSWPPSDQPSVANTGSTSLSVHSHLHLFKIYQQLITTVHKLFGTVHQQTNIKPSGKWLWFFSVGAQAEAATTKGKGSFW